ncbi:hypothetical protein [Streptomyces sp. NPDC059122]|uniref:hypothetical protein n=1 Tax=Streptomyces sp. NPDC059122 TaxID=3346732 RepID=UPI0036927992
MVAEHGPDAVLPDLHIPVTDGVEATRRLVAVHPEAAVVALTTYVDDAPVLRTLCAGARAYPTWNADRLRIPRTLHSAAAGLAVLDPSPGARRRFSGGRVPMPFLRGIVRRKIEEHVHGCPKGHTAGAERPKSGAIFPLIGLLLFQRQISSSERYRRRGVRCSSGAR